MKPGNGSEMDRRTLLKGAAATGVAGAAATAVLDAPAEAQDKGARRDPNVKTQAITFRSGGDTINGFLAQPASGQKTGAVIICPDIFGMTDYAREVTAQIAQAGLIGLAVDFYTRQGGAPQTMDFAVLRAAVGKIPDQQLIGDLQAGIDYLKGRNITNGKFGVTGFCMGGRYSLLLAAHSPDIVAASPYYGPVTASGPDRMAAMDHTTKIKAAVQGHYGATDMNPKPDDVRAFYAKLKQTNPNAEFYIYEGAGHAFHSYGRPSFNAEAAGTAWNRTLEFFKKHLR